MTNEVFIAIEQIGFYNISTGEFKTEVLSNYGISNYVVIRKPSGKNAVYRYIMVLIECRYLIFILDVYMYVSNNFMIVFIF